MTIGVTGATGKLGRLVIQKLRERPDHNEIYALVRSASKGEDLQVNLREADYSKAQTLGTAIQGIEKLLLISSSEVGKRVVQHQNVIDAAKKAGVRQIVYTSLLHADTSVLKALADEHVVTERSLINSGVPYTILRNGCYMENYFMGIPAALKHGSLIGCAGDGEIAFAPRMDYAEAAVMALTSDGHEGKTYELAGDTAYTLKDLAQEISKQFQREITYQNLSKFEFAAALKQVGVPDMGAEFLAAFDDGVSKGAFYHEGNELSEIIGRATTKLSEINLTALV